MTLNTWFSNTGWSDFCRGAIHRALHGRETGHAGRNENGTQGAMNGAPTGIVGRM